jgi:PKD repeat protein
MTRYATVAGVLALCAACGGGKVDTVTRKPVASFEYIQSNARPQVFSLDASGSSATVGELNKWIWTFGDENGAPRTELTTGTTGHKYSAPGNYQITLVVTDDKGAESEPVTKQVNVPSINNELPKAVISGPSTGSPGVILAFDGTGSTPASDIKSYGWNFGDPNSGAGNVSTEKGAQHVFSSTGSFHVTLKGTDSLQQSDTAEVIVAIAAVGPLAVCVWTPAPALQGVELTFDGSNSSAPGGATIKAWLWDFDDGSQPVPGKTVKYTYNVQATFKPKLQVIDSLNRVGEAVCADVVVQAPPMCSGNYSLTATNNPTCGGGNVNWAGVKLAIVETAPNTIVSTETAQPGEPFTAPDGGSTITYSGTFNGASFTMQGQYIEKNRLGDVPSDVTIKGTFTGCSGWTGTWYEKKTYQGFTLCDFTVNISSTKL